MTSALGLKLSSFFNSNGSLVFGAISLLSFGGALFFTAKGQMNADDILAERDEYYRSIERADEIEKTEKTETKEESDVEVVPKISFKERWHLTWKCYIPAFICAVIAIASTIAGSYISWKKIAALGSTVGILVTQRDEFEKAARLKFGDEAVDEIKNRLAIDRYNKATKEPNVTYINRYAEETGHGDLLCYESYTGKYFRATEEWVKDGEDKFNFGLVNYGLASFNDLYRFWEVTKTDFGSRWGWHVYDEKDSNVIYPTEGVIFEHTITHNDVMGEDMLVIKLVDEPEDFFYEHYDDAHKPHSL